MDEEELEQPRKKITLSNFFESIQSIDKVANRALNKTESNLGIISENKSLIEALSKSFDNIKTEVREIKEYVMIKDEDKDKLFSQEDQEQKIKRLERLQGIGDKPSKDDGDFKKQASEIVKKALQDPNVMQIFAGLIGLSVSGLLGIGVSTFKSNKSLNEKFNNLSKSDRNYVKGRTLPFTFGKEKETSSETKSKNNKTSDGNFFTNIFDKIRNFDGTPGSRPTKDTRSFEEKFLDDGINDEGIFKNDDLVGKGESIYKFEGTRDTAEGKDKLIIILQDKIDKLDNAEEIPGADLDSILAKKDTLEEAKDILITGEVTNDSGGNDYLQKFLKEQNQEDKAKELKFGTEIGGVDGPDGIDRIPAMLTKGETVLSKDESENLKEMGVFNVDRLVSGVKKMYNKDDEVDKFSFEMMKKFEGYSETAYPDVVDDDGNVLQYAIGHGSSFLPPFITGEEKSRPVRKSDKITKKQATELKEFDIDRIQDTINSELSDVGLKLDDLPVRVSSVLTSLGFNYGSLEGVHPLKDRKFNEGKSDTDKSKYTQSVVQMIKSGHDKNDFTNFANFLEFNKSQDKPGTGLEARRKDESLIIKTGSGSDYYGLQNLNIPESSDDLQSLSENNSISPIIESKSNQLAENIFTPPSTENNKINLLPIPMNQQQSQPTDGNVPVTAPKNTPQVTTTPVASTISSVSFVNMISNKELSIG